MTRIALHFRGKQPTFSSTSRYSGDGGCHFFLSITATIAEVECMKVHPTSKGCESWRLQGSNNCKKGCRSENEIALIQRNSE